MPGVSKAEWARRGLKQIAFGIAFGAVAGAVVGFLHHGELHVGSIARGVIVFSGAVLLIVALLSVLTRFGRDI